ncbi:hypothetical protein LROSL1_0177 [Furfurilactobacillus rossiae]|uniref:bacteriocin immunity protein n=1 Tax=Furfurilactobacillus rossiae TaxID=231049 RepID=UPI0015BA9DF9|nr:bacteriocin immunity protein [Furfurilactobacillus rossiae]MCF6166020.1 bacteriocin immunity protein [Furfurilactobacillus rossiae]QLE62997.1 hypothetical protein LROSL1_0177 [Furfurilactobacillus rossiae]
MNKSQTAVFNDIDKAYQDDEIQAIPELRDMLLGYAKQLNNNGNDDVIVAKVRSDISKYAILHQYQVPKALHDLYHDLDHKTHYGNTNVVPFIIN